MWEGDTIYISGAHLKVHHTAGIVLVADTTIDAGDGLGHNELLILTVEEWGHFLKIAKTGVLDIEKEK